MKATRSAAAGVLVYITLTHFIFSFLTTLEDFLAGSFRFIFL